MRALWLLPLVVAGCSDPANDVPFPQDYAADYSLVRDCRRSGDHDLNYIRVLTDLAATPVYGDRDQRFPEGAVVLKEEYDFVDDSCSGDLVGWTVMVRLAEDRSDGEALGWAWFQIDPDRGIVSEDLPRCYGCHALCVDVGHDGTCAEP